MVTRTTKRDVLESNATIGMRIYQGESVTTAERADGVQSAQVRPVETPSSALSMCLCMYERDALHVDREEDEQVTRLYILAMVMVKLRSERLNSK